MRERGQLSYNESLLISISQIFQHSRVYGGFRLDLWKTVPLALLCSSGTVDPLLCLWIEACHGEECERSMIMYIV